MTVRRVLGTRPVSLSAARNVSNRRDISLDRLGVPDHLVEEPVTQRLCRGLVGRLVHVDLLGRYDPIEIGVRHRSLAGQGGAVVLDESNLELCHSRPLYQLVGAVTCR